METAGWKRILHRSDRPRDAVLRWYRGYSHWSPPFFRRRCRPIAMITGSSGKTTTTRMLAHILTASGRTVGSVDSDEVRVAGIQEKNAGTNKYENARYLSGRGDAEVLVLEINRKNIVRNSLYFKYCDVGALLNVGFEHVGLDGVNSLEELAEIKRRVIDMSRGGVVLNADDTLVSSFIDDFEPSRVTLFSLGAQDELLKRHVETGGKAIHVSSQNGKSILWSQGGDQRLLATVDMLPSTQGGIVEFNAANALAAAALAECLGVDIVDAIAGLSSFDNDIEDSPGRFNRLDGYSLDLVLDQCCSPPAAKMLAKTVSNLSVPGRRICMLTTPGNRTDQHYTLMAEALADAFDTFVCYDLFEYRRGRERGEIAGLLRDGLLENGVQPEAIKTALTYEAGLDVMAELAQPGDLAMVLGGPERRNPALVRAAFQSHLLP